MYWMEIEDIDRIIDRIIDSDIYLIKDDSSDRH